MAWVKMTVNVGRADGGNISRVEQEV
jgi:hypothetical protein